MGHHSRGVVATGPGGVGQDQTKTETQVFTVMVSPSNMAILIKGLNHHMLMTIYLTQWILILPIPEKIGQGAEGEEEEAEEEEGGHMERTEG